MDIGNDGDSHRALSAPLLSGATEAAYGSATHSWAASSGENEFLDEKESRLELLQADLHKQFDQLEREREQLRVGTEVLEGRQKSQRDKAVKKWFEIFQTMKPAPAAAVLESLEDSVAREVLSRLESRKASKILDAMNPERVVALVGDGLQKGNQ